MLSYKGVIIRLVSHEAEMQFVTFHIMNELTG